VTVVGGNLKKLGTALIVKLEHQIRIRGPAFRRCHILYSMVLPQTVGIPKGFNATFGTDACTREYDYFFQGKFV
jgi:hypothetical protein